MFRAFVFFCVVYVFVASHVGWLGLFGCSSCAPRARSAAPRASSGIHEGSVFLICFIIHPSALDITRCGNIYSVPVIDISIWFLRADHLPVISMPTVCWKLDISGQSRVLFKLTVDEVMDLHRVQWNQECEHGVSFL